MDKESKQQEHQDYYQHYELLMRILHREVESLFNRLNFFLVCTAFLIAAFVAAVVTYHQGGWPLNLLRHAIAAIGFYVALLFTLTNYLNAQLITGIQEKLEKDGDIVGMKPYRVISVIMEHNWNFKEWWQELRELLCDPIEYSKHNRSPHTWLIPILFVLFWLIVWFTVLPFGQAGQVWWHQVLVPGVFGVLIPVVYCKRRCCTKTRERLRKLGSIRYKLI